MGNEPITSFLSPKLTKQVIFVVIGAAVIILGIAGFFFYKNYQFKDQSTQTGLTSSVIDCTDNTCVDRRLDYNITNCERHWYPGKEAAPPACDKTKQALEAITYIADLANYIPIPFTSEEFAAEIVNIRLDSPWDLEFLPDGSFLVTQNNGQIIHYDNGRTNVVLNLSDDFLAGVDLMGLAIDPDFLANHYIYIYYTYQLDQTHSTYTNFKEAGERRVLNRISRFTFDSGRLFNETILVGNIPGTIWHSGGRLEFGPDDKLYAGTGDAGERTLAQDISFLGGKILRLNTDGTVPEDNPFADSYVYSLGHRNPQGLSWHPETGSLYNSEHGDWRYDEINRVVPGANHGWGAYECEDKVTSFKPNIELQTLTMVTPVVCTKTWTMAPSGIEFISDTNSPWYSSLFVASLRGKHLHRYKFEGGKVSVDEIFFVGKKHLKENDVNKINQRIRDVEYFKGSLYVLGSGHGLVKISPLSK